MNKAVKQYAYFFIKVSLVRQAEANTATNISLIKSFKSFDSTESVVSLSKEAKARVQLSPLKINTTNYQDRLNFFVFLRDFSCLLLDFSE